MKKETKSSYDAVKNIFFVHKILIQENKSLYFLRIPLIALNILSSYSSIYFLRLILNELASEKNITVLILYVVCMAVISIILSFIKRILNLYDARQVLKTDRKIKCMLGSMVTKMSFSDLDEPRVKDFIALAESSNAFSDIIAYTTDFLSAVLKIITYGSLVLTAQPIIVVLIIIVLILEMWFDRLKRDNEYMWRVRQAPVTRRLNYFSTILCDPKYGKEMRVNGLQDYFFEKKKNYTDEVYMKMICKSIKMDNKLYFFVEVAKLFRKITIYFILGIKVFFGGMLIGDFSMALSSTDQLTESISMVIGSYSKLISCGMFASEFRYCMDISEKAQSSSGESVISGEKNHSIEFRNVSFHYPHSDTYVLKNVSFRIEAGEKVSIVGVNGSGKSTLVKLLCHFYEPNEGEILIDDVNIRDLAPDEISKVLGVVFQDYNIFPFTVRENVALDVQINDKRVNECLKSIGLSEKVEKLSCGLNTMIYKIFDDDGVEFSGGEAQKLAISRIVYADAPIFVLDEPTSALDPIAEYDLFGKFNEISSRKTVIFISHRLSSTRLSDKIAVISDGELVEFGSHADLMKIDEGIYKNMFTEQAKYYE